MLRLWNPRRSDSEHSVDRDRGPRPRTANRVSSQNSTRSRPVSSADVADMIEMPTFKGRPLVASSSKVQPYPSSDMPRLTKTPWELERYKRNSIWRRSKPLCQFPAHFFQELPREVYDCVLLQLEHIHLSHDQACSSCYLKDLYNLSLTSRAWGKAAASLMYRKIPVLTNEDPTKMLRPKTRGTSRLKLLRRTLRERHALAQHVRELHLSDFQALYQCASIERQEIVNLVASLVMACPYLERLVGFHIPYQQSFDRLTHALSTRSNLRERVWLLAEADMELLEDEDDDLGAYYHDACDPTERFLGFNSRHPMLSTIVLHQELGNPHASLNFRAIVGTLRQFPVLRHLSISGLVATSFTNLALNALPPHLQSLRLERLPGISDRGLQRFATSRLGTSLETLALIDLDVTSLVTLSNVLSTHLGSLKHFSLIQDRAPGLSSQTSVPDFYSPSLQSLHWELRSQAGPLLSLFPPSSPSTPELPSFPFANPEPLCCLATSLLALGIKDGALPSLRQIRIPHDPQGVIQALCKPLATALLPSDISLLQAPPQSSGSNEVSIIPDSDDPFSQKLHNCSAYATPSSRRADSAIDSPISTRSFAQEELTPMRSRLAAHSRILAAKSETCMTFRVHDPEGVVEIEKSVGGFMGQVGSKIVYDLKPDRCRSGSGVSAEEGTEWITGVEDLVGREDFEGGERKRSCGHSVDGRIGSNVVMVEDIF